MGLSPVELPFTEMRKMGGGRVGEGTTKSDGPYVGAAIGHPSGGGRSAMQV